MGASYSEPVPSPNENIGYVSVVFRMHDKVRLVNAPPIAVEAITKVISEISHTENAPMEDKYGVLQFRLPGSPFSANSSRDSITVGRLFILRILEEMYMAGYEPCVNSCLSRDGFDQGTMFFRKSKQASIHADELDDKIGEIIGVDGKQVGRGQVICCVAPTSTDKLVLIRCNESYTAAKEAIKQGWPQGVQHERPIESVCGETLIEIKLKGNPWSHNEGYEESLQSRILILSMIERLSLMNWRFLTSVNLKCCPAGDAMFFVKDLNHTRQEGSLAMISPTKRDRIWMQCFDRSTTASVRATLLRFYTASKKLEECDLVGVGGNHGLAMASSATEFKLKGYPFWTSDSSGDEGGIATRQTMCRILETLRESGWEVVTTMNLSRNSGGSRAYSNDHKTTFVLSRCESARIKFACISPADVDRLWLLNFPYQVMQTLRTIVQENYKPGIAYEESSDAGSRHLMVLNGSPWTQNSSFSLHANSMLNVLLKETSKYGWHPVGSADITARMVRQGNENVHTDYPVDVASWYFCFLGVPFGIHLPPSRPPSANKVDFAELKVSDLEEIHLPSEPSYQARPATSASSKQGSLLNVPPASSYGRSLSGPNERSQRSASRTSTKSRGDHVRDVSSAWNRSTTSMF